MRFACIYEPGAQGGHKRVLHNLEVELQMVVSHQVNT